VPPPQRSQVFGGYPSKGDVVSVVGQDAIISIGGTLSYEIERIKPSYAIGLGADYESSIGTTSPNVAGSRSFSGRIVVVRSSNPIVNTLSNGTPNVYFGTNIWDTNLGEIIFDKMLHDFKYPYDYVFPVGDGIGHLRNKNGEFLNVILFAGQHISNVNGIGFYSTYQMLHVCARIYNDNPSIVTEGNFVTKD
jgi:hypothetical protein